MEGILDRLKDAVWLRYSKPYILVAGAGGIGSWTTLFLARAGLAPFLVDFDTIEVHNMGGQMFSKDQIGKSKVSAVQENVKKFCDKEIVIFEERVGTDYHNMGPFVVAAFDNMEARKNLSEAWYKSCGDNPEALFIDGRLTAEQIQIICVTPDKYERYKKEYLFSDSEVEDTICTFKQTSHAAALIGAHITGFITNHFSNLVEGNKSRAVPFFWEYYIPINLTTEIYE